MKTLKFPLMIMIFGLLTLNLASCNKDDDGGDGGSAPAGTIQAKIDGRTFTSAAVSSQATIVNAGSTSTLNIFGTDLGGNALSLVLNGVTGPGTYVIGGDNLVSISASYTEVNTTTFQTVSWAAPYEGGEEAGEIKIAELDETKVVGTFNFTAKNDDESPKEFTEGSFNMNF